MDRFIGKRLDGRYEISELIGVGGMAVVYKAYDSIDDRTVAVKILKEEFLANEEFRRRFKNESKAIAVLSHPNIVKVYDVSFGDVLQYIVMEYINGITLKDYISQQGVISWQEAAHFTVQVLRALGNAHEKGIVHRDIKPQNIMLLPDGTIKVTDFGIARFSRSEQKTITDKAIGSVHYISPEQARGDFTDGKADIYSVGVLLYEMTTGKVPFQAESAVSVAIMQLQNEPVHPCAINDSIPKGLEQITLKAMQKDPNNRYKTAYDMLVEIEQVQADPNILFKHQFFVDSSPTKVIDIKGSDDKESEKQAPREPEEKKSVLIPVLAGIASVFVLGLVIALLFVFGIFSNTGDTVKCPDFVGMNYRELIKDKKFEEWWDNFKPEFQKNTEMKKDYIYDQTPDADSSIKTGSDITLYVSLGAEELVLADYSSKTFEIANEEMKALGLKPVRTDVADEEVPEGYVIKTVPPVNSTVSVGDTITVYVSTGEDIPEIAAPDYKGMKLDDAKLAVERDGLKVGSISYVYDNSMAVGYVVSQSPEKGKTIQLESSINLFVSKGAKTTAANTTTGSVTSSISAEIPLPDVDATVTLSVWVNGVEDKSVNVNLNDTSSYSFTLTGSGKSNKVVIRISDLFYREYDFNFTNGTYNLVDKNDDEVISSLQGDPAE